jgi:hypothetical protein
MRTRMSGGVGGRGLMPPPIPIDGKAVDHCYGIAVGMKMTRQILIVVACRLHTYEGELGVVVGNGRFDYLT